MINIAGIVHNGRASGGSMRAFILAALLAALFGSLAGACFADMPQVYRSWSTRQIVGWEDAEGYHACRSGQDCDVPLEYDLVWVE